MKKKNYENECNMTRLSTDPSAKLSKVFQYNNSYLVCFLSVKTHKIQIQQQQKHEISLMKFFNHKNEAYLFSFPSENTTDTKKGNPKNPLCSRNSVCSTATQYDAHKKCVVVVFLIFHYLFLLFCTSL
jgi:hypothetical protein